MNLVCNVLGWDKNEIDRCGGTVNSYMKENIKHGGISFAFDWEKNDDKAWLMTVCTKYV